jgi:hypothetical protein
MVKMKSIIYVHLNVTLQTRRRKIWRGINEEFFVINLLHIAALRKSALNYYNPAS